MSRYDPNAERRAFSWSSAWAGSHKNERMLPGRAAGGSPGVTEELCLLSFLPPDQPLPEGRVYKHPGHVPALDEEHGEVVHPLLEVLPLQGLFHAPCIDGLEDVLVSQGMQGGHGHVQEGHDPVKGRLRGELHVALQQVDLRQGDGDDFIAGALQDQVALFDEIKSELQVQVGALAQGFEVGAEFAKGRVVHLAIQGDVILDLRAAVYSVQDVALEVLIYRFVFFQSIQEYPMEG